MPDNTPDNPAPGSTAASVARAVKQVVPGIAILIFGVLLPVFTLITELSTAMCAEAFFDPIPTLAHTILVALVPAGNFIVWYSMYSNRSTHLRSLAVLNGIVLGVAGFYTILFLPITPIAIMASWLGIGLLPLSPALSLVAAIICRRHLSTRIKQAPESTPLILYRVWPGVVISLLLVIGIQLPTTLTQYGIQQAASSDPEQQASGVRFLRDWGNEEELLRACYRRTGRIPDMLSFLFTFGEPRAYPETAQTIYYRVTGKPFNTVSPPLPRRSGFASTDDRFLFDNARGGDQVAGRINSLSLASSSMDGSVDADAALAYLEWTFIVKNSAPFAEEARMQVALPPGATVSRVTLWVNGEPREAAFAGRAKVRAAYQSVVRRSRDPLLVTMSAPDTLMVQMFPVPAHGEMKARIGISMPLHLEDKTTAILQLPHIRERNYGINTTVRHSVWLESSQRINVSNNIGVIGDLGSPTQNKDHYALHGSVSDSKLQDTSSLIRFYRNPQVTTAYTKDLKSKPATYIRQEMSFKYRISGHTVIVVDGSSSMDAYKDQIADIIETLPDDSRFSVLLAGDETINLTGKHSRHYEQVASKIRDHHYTGGTDNIPALNLAWELSRNDGNSNIVWIHGPQPVRLSSVDTLHNHWQRQTDSPVLHDLALNTREDTGRNRIAENLVDIPVYRTVPRSGNLQQDLSLLTKKLTGKKKWVNLNYTRLTHAPSKPGATKTSDHLTRLWARNKVDQLITGGKPGKVKMAIQLARKYQLVTPVSGAVVLETAAQYKRAGLKPVDAASVPTVPEPEEWALLIICLITLTWFWRRQSNIKYRNNKTRLAC